MTHPLQTAAWAEFRKAMGVDMEKIDDWWVSFHAIPYTPWTVGYFPKGPAPDEKLLQKLRSLGIKKNAIYIQLEPNIKKNDASGSISTALIPSHHPLFTKYTFILDLTQSEEHLLKQMHPKARYNIKVAQKHGVNILEDNSARAFDAYLSLSYETTTRQGFYAHNKTYHQTMWNILRAAGIAHLFTASYKGEIIAAWILFAWNNTLYYPYGASSRSHREVMAPHLLFWKIVQWAKEKKYTAFDLWGAIGPNPDPTDPWYGFHRFKEGFRPQLVEYIGSYDFILKPIPYRLFCIADAIRWKLLSFRR